MVRNLEHIRARDPQLYEALTDIIQQAGNVSQQTNANQTGQPSSPPAISGLKVTGQNGHFHVSISDENPAYRDVHYYAEYADNPNFTNPYVIHMGHTRNHTVFLGNGTYYWRAYSAYASSPPGAAAYHGGQESPAPVEGGGSIGGPAFLPSQGSGTGVPGAGLQGPGVAAFRSPNGIPPVR